MMSAQKERLAGWIRTRPALAAGILALVVIVVVVGALRLAGRVGSGAGSQGQGSFTHTGPGASWAPNGQPPLLPGETLWDGVPSMLWGTNDTQDWDPQHSLITEPAIQREVKADHLALIRTWLFQIDLLSNQPETDAYQQSKVQAALNTGARLLCELPTGNTMDYDEHMVTLFAGKCSYYEFMNEPDYENVSVASYVAQWASEIPRLRAIDPHALFGGPATAPTNSGCVTTNGTTECYMQRALQGMAQSGVKPDFVSFHWYPCWQNSAGYCLTLAGSYGDEVRAVRGWLTQYFGAAGARMPIGITEWNADPSAPMPAYTKDTCWIEQFSVNALKSMAEAGVSFADQFDLANYGGYGSDDMTDVFQNGAAKPQYVALLRLLDTISPYGELPMPPLAFKPPAANCAGVP